MRRAFTLIELLVVVAILAILTAIALPNFLAAQTRAKVARAEADLRTITLGLEAYHVDHNHYPPAGGVGFFGFFGSQFANPVSQLLIPLTTPSAYLSSIPRDPFLPRTSNQGDLWEDYPYDTYDYVDVPTKQGAGSELTSGGIWRTMSAGPDLDFNAGGYDASIDNFMANRRGVDYDPTNGTISVGEIVRVGAPAPTIGGGRPDDLDNPNRPAILRVPFYREQWCLCGD
jgi:prepilin-type N-terminal cleavage/methylation domain-containing protein